MTTNGFQHLVSPSWEAMTATILLGIDLYSRLKYSGATAFQTFCANSFIPSFDVALSFLSCSLIMSLVKRTLFNSTMDCWLPKESHLMVKKEKIEKRFLLNKNDSWAEEKMTMIKNKIWLNFCHFRFGHFYSNCSHFWTKQDRRMRIAPVYWKFFAVVKTYQIFKHRK